MITAKEAREKIETLKTERGKKEMKIAEAKVTTALENGESCCWLGIYISDPTFNKLKDLGYTVEQISSQRDGDDTKVKW